MLLPSASRAPSRQTAKAYSVPAPVGGLNFASPMAALPVSDCLILENMTPAEYGLRVRLGYSAFATGLTDPVRTMIPFYGAVAADHRLFAVTKEGIWNVTPGGAIASKVTITDDASRAWSNAGNAGYGSFHTVVTSGGGHLLLYCDEVNGLYVYSASTATWYVVLGNTGTNCRIDSGISPEDAVFVTVWKHRVILVRRNTGTAYYFGLDEAPFPGAHPLTTPLSFAGKFRQGGWLVGLWNWTYDGGSGIDDALVAISSGGDVVIYEGTDPTIPGAFQLKGVWYAGGVPAGRRICSEVGGDLLLATRTGAIPLSKLVVGNLTTDLSQYATQKIGNLFSYLMQQYATYLGWSIMLHPQDNALIINVPSADFTVTRQLVMSITTRCWSQFSYTQPNINLVSGCPWQGKVYYGSGDGRVLLNDGYVDEDASIPFFVLTSYQKLGSPRMKRVQIIRPTVNAQGIAPAYTVRSKYRYDLDQFTGGEQVSALSGAVFTTDGAAEPPAHALFDVAVFSATDFFSEQRTTGGAGGIGPEVAIAMSGRASARTTLVGWDVIYDEGGLL